MSKSSRILLLLAAVVAAYDIVAGIDNFAALTVFYFTLGFGILLLSSLLILLMGYEILDNPLVVFVATVLPVSMSLGLVHEYIPTWHRIYLIFAVFGTVLILLLKYFKPGKLATVVLAAVHSVAGFIILILPVYYALTGVKNLSFALLGIGGMFIGLFGVLLTVLKIGKTGLSREKIYALFPLALLATTVLFSVGLHFA